MPEVERADAIRGKTMRWSWHDGPTKGQTYEHRFDADGTVTWRSVKPGEPPVAPGKPGPSGERAPYAAVRLSDEICLVSYLAPSGFTLTVAVDFSSGGLTGIASNAASWYVVRGSFELVD